MAIERNITDDDDWFTGEDKSLVFTITGETITGWALSWMVKKHKSDADADAKITKTVGSGITIATPVATVAVTDDDTSALAPGVYWHELKRTDAGLETVLTYGSAVLRQAVHR